MFPNNTSTVNTSTTLTFILIISLFMIDLFFLWATLWSGFNGYEVQCFGFETVRLQHFGINKITYMFFVLN